MFTRIARFVLEHRLAVALTLTVVIVVALGGSLRLQADFSAMAFYGGGDPEVDRLVAYKERWGKDDAMVMVIVTAEDGGDLLTGSRLRALDTLVERLRADASLSTVSAVTSAPLLLGEPGVLDVSPVIDRLPDGEPLGRLREQILADPMIVPSFVSEDGRAAAIFAELAADPDDIGALRPAVLALRQVLRDWEAADGAGLSLATAGVPAVRTDFFQLILADQTRTVPLLMLVLAGLLFVVFRRVHGVLAPSVAAMVPALMVFGVMGWTGEPIGILNQSYFTLLPVIAIADAIHMVSRFHEEVRRRVAPGEAPGPEVRRAAIRAAMSAIGGACFLTSLTTAIGFSSLGAARMPILRTFGGYAALGIVCAYGTVLLVIPLLLSWSRGSVPEAGRPESPTPIDRFLLGCADLCLARPWPILAVTAAVLAGALVAAQHVVVDNTLTGLLSPDHETSRAGRIADEQLGGILGAEVELSGPPGAMTDPATLRAMDEITSWALAQPEVRAVVGPSTWISLLHQALAGRPGIPDTRAGVAQLMLLAEGDGRIEELLSIDGDHARLTVRTRDDGGNAFAAFADRLAPVIARALDGLPVTGHITGTPHVAYRGINGVTTDLRDSLIVAFLAVSLVLSLLFRSIRLAALALIPNALPLVLGYGLMGLVGWRLDPTPAVVFTVALGIAVDDTIHLLVRYREERAGGLAMPEALRSSVLHTGRAVTMTTILLCVGFGLNSLSSFPSMQILGILGAFVIFVALIGDLFVLPALLVLADRDRPEVSP